MRHHSAVAVEDRVEDQGAQFFRVLTLRIRDTLDDRFENFLDPQPRLGAGQNRLFGRYREDIFELLFHRGNVRVGQIDLVDDRHEGEPLFHRQMDIRDGLRLDPLRSIDDQQRTFARSE